MTDSFTKSSRIQNALETMTKEIEEQRVLKDQLTKQNKDIIESNEILKKTIEKRVQKFYGSSNILKLKRQEHQHQVASMKKMYYRYKKYQKQIGPDGKPDPTYLIKAIEKLKEDILAQISKANEFREKHLQLARSFNQFKFRYLSEEQLKQENIQLVQRIEEKEVKIKNYEFNEFNDFLANLADLKNQCSRQQKLYDYDVYGMKDKITGIYENLKETDTLLKMAQELMELPPDAEISESEFPMKHFFIGAQESTTEGFMTPSELPTSALIDDSSDEISDDEEGSDDFEDDSDEESIKRKNQSDKRSKSFRASPRASDKVIEKGKGRLLEKEKSYGKASLRSKSVPRRNFEEISSDDDDDEPKKHSFRSKRVVESSESEDVSNRKNKRKKSPLVDSSESEREVTKKKLIIRDKLGRSESEDAYQEKKKQTMSQKSIKPDLEEKKSLKKIVRSSSQQNEQQISGDGRKQSKEKMIREAQSKLEKSPKLLSGKIPPVQSQTVRLKSTPRKISQNDSVNKNVNPEEHSSQSSQPEEIIEYEEEVDDNPVLPELGMKRTEFESFQAKYENNKKDIQTWTRRVQNSEKELQKLISDVDTLQDQLEYELLLHPEALQKPHIQMNVDVGTIILGTAQIHRDYKNVQSQTDFSGDDFDKLEKQIYKNNETIIDSLLEETDATFISQLIPQLKQVLVSNENKNKKREEDISYLERKLHSVCPDSDSIIGSKQTRQKQQFERAFASKQEELTGLKNSISTIEQEIESLKGEIEDQKSLHAIIKKRISQQQQMKKPDVKEMSASLANWRDAEQKKKQHLKMLELEEQDIDSRITRLNQQISSIALSKEKEEVEELRRKVNVLKQEFRSKLKPGSKTDVNYTSKEDMRSMENQIADLSKKIKDCEQQEKQIRSNIAKSIIEVNKKQIPLPPNPLYNHSPVDHLPNSDSP